MSNTIRYALVRNCQMVIDYQNSFNIWQSCNFAICLQIFKISFAVRMNSIFAIKLFLNIPLHLKHVTTLLFLKRLCLEIVMLKQSKLSCKWLPTRTRQECSVLFLWLTKGTDFLLFLFVFIVSYSLPLVLSSVFPFLSVPLSCRKPSLLAVLGLSRTSTWALIPHSVVSGWICD